MWYYIFVIILFFKYALFLFILWSHKLIVVDYNPRHLKLIISLIKNREICSIDHVDVTTSKMLFCQRNSAQTLFPGLTVVRLYNPLGTRRCCDVESTSLTLIQRRNNVVCPVGRHLSGDLISASVIRMYQVVSLDGLNQGRGYAGVNTNRSHLCPGGQTRRSRGLAQVILHKHKVSGTFGWSTPRALKTLPRQNPAGPHLYLYVPCVYCQ